MLTFKKKNLLEKPRSLGEKLKEAREKQHLSLDRISKKVGIKKRYILALEENTLNQLPGGLYAKKFIKKYSKFLNLDQKEVDKYIKENFNTNNSHTEYFSHKKLSKKKFLVFPRIVRYILIVSVMIICLLYLAFYFNKLISPPKLEINNPKTNISTNKNPITIKGETEKETEVYINGSTVLIDKDGYFEKDITLKKGINKIIIEAKQRYSRTNVKTRQIKLE